MPRKNRPDVYMSPGDPYTGPSPGVEPFISWLRGTVFDTSDDEALRSWAAMVVRSPEQAAEELQCIREIADSPPPDLVLIMKQYGSVYLYERKKHRRIPRPDSAYRTWLQNRVQQFSEIAEEHGLPNLTSMEREAGN
ncbi:hypothetical protein [Streptomyces sp. NBC_01768]|uniref:hypothetical protein n=1 Tax=Streptomyces sp. NBC_01768 TaxID=2975938 RepID=UPI002DDBADD6|nr:hypothetical protein [Streptomyces sp. NBC_01768]WSC32173.1 hypothetical protein OG902_38885 [Streptomyces sp. NBC_01768]